MPDLTLAELLCSRLCHDLIGPVTAVAHGIEFLADDDPNMRQQALDLMGKSAAQGTACLQFYRVAFGQAASAGESIPRAEVAGLVAGLLQGGKVKVTWGAGTGDPSRRTARLFLNLIQIGAEALVRGGALAIDLACDAQGERCRIAGTGPAVRLPEGAEAALAAERLDARLIQPYYARVLASVLGARLALTLAPPGAITLDALVPAPT
ncbi:MAG: histidine phosphotransferase [Alphaproteobacteria bacterium]|nr:histidine phosphotransferase [Alphaproteobacteria bacterium]